MEGKIWIEKLIELLNEYVEETDFWDNLDEYNEAEILDEETLEVNWKYHDIEYLYTKKFWFIEWLYNHKKMTLERLRISDLYWDINNWVWTVDNIIMHLSISENPIDLLISLLK